MPELVLPGPKIRRRDPVKGKIALQTGMLLFEIARKVAPMARAEPFVIYLHLLAGSAAKRDTAGYALGH